MTVRSARVLFSGGFRPSRTLGGGGGKRNWTELFFPEGEPQYDTFWNGSSGRGCTMTRFLLRFRNWSSFEIVKTEAHFDAGLESTRCAALRKTVPELDIV